MKKRGRVPVLGFEPRNATEVVKLRRQLIPPSFNRHRYEGPNRYTDRSGPKGAFSVATAVPAG